MFSRRNLLGALAGLIPGLGLLKPKAIEPTVIFEEALPNIRIDPTFEHFTQKITLLGDYKYCVENSNGDKTYYYCHLRHREDGPAVIKANGEEEWYFEGQHHREGGPAMTHFCQKPDGSSNKGEYWYRHGKAHREDGPAIVYEDGHKEWKINGELHREDGPAQISCDGSAWWYRYDKLHREDGPAKESSNGSKEWWINGKLHREDGPAKILCCKGKIIRREWILNHKLHREDGPAIEVMDGNEYWGGSKYWYEHGVHTQTTNKHGEITFSQAYTDFSLSQI